MRLLFLTLILISVVGCKRPINNPQNLDPVYNSYRHEAEELKSSIEAQRLDVDKTASLVEKYTVEQGDKREMVAELFEQKGKLQKSEERLLFLTSKMHEVAKKDGAEYLTAFKAGKEWPNPEDLKTFELEKSFAESGGKEWSAVKRIKKLLHKKIVGGVVQNDTESAKPAEPTGDGHESHE